MIFLPEERDRPIPEWDALPQHHAKYIKPWDDFLPRLQWDDRWQRDEHGYIETEEKGSYHDDIDLREAEYAVGMGMNPTGCRGVTHLAVLLQNVIPECREHAMRMCERDGVDAQGLFAAYDFLVKTKEAVCE